MNHWVASLVIALPISSVLLLTPPSLIAAAPANADAAAPSPSEPESPDLVAIRACFAAYKAALVSRDGAAAVEQVSTSTLEYYGQMRELALYAKQAELQKRSLTDQYIVLTLRHRVGLPDLQPMTAADVVRLAIEEGWTGDSEVKTLDLGTVTVDGNQARGNLKMLNEPENSEFAFVFVKEPEGWKLDITKLLFAAEAFLQDWLMTDDTPPAAGLITLLEFVSERQVSPDIWLPLIERQEPEPAP